MKIETIPISQLKFAAYNPRKISESQMKSLKESLSKFGFINPVIVNKNENRKNTVVGGHMRIRAWQELGNDFVPVFFVDLEEKREKELNIRLNKNVGEFDWDILSAEFEEIDLKSWGFEDSDFDFINQLPPDETVGDDDVPKITKDVITKIGDLYVLGSHRLLCGDAAILSDFERLLNGEKAKICITDPPYGVSYADKNKFLNSIDKGNRNQKEIKNDHLLGKDVQELWKIVFSNIALNLEPVNAYYIFSPQIQGMMMMMMMEAAGLPYRHVLIWVKNNHVLGRCDYHYKHESILYGWTQTHKFYGHGKFNTSVWDVAKPQKSDLHPTMKPVMLMENMLLDSSKKNDICLDPFGGSGSTLIACEKTDRQSRTIEIDPHYCDVIVRRYVDFCKKNNKPFSISRNGILINPKEFN